MKSGIYVSISVSKSECAVSKSECVFEKANGNYPVAPPDQVFSSFNGDDKVRIPQDPLGNFIQVRSNFSKLEDTETGRQLDWKIGVSNFRNCHSGSWKRIFILINLKWCFWSSKELT